VAGGHHGRAKLWGPLIGPVVAVLSFVCSVGNVPLAVVLWKGTFFAAMAAAGYVIELVFGGLGLIPSSTTAKIPDSGVSWDYATWLNIAFLLLAAALVVRFARTGAAVGAARAAGRTTSGTARPRAATRSRRHSTRPGTASSRAGPAVADG
jgi:hypothetical protein